ncbi:Glyoxalase/Bleomycin resistance protein/Dioxygenase superfamily protein [Arboricoccus pini]|uniref:Glyoxalase/Bleomycin resistance protein/Dioxygenase superfamily protein n=1 Tax=Arboricoccus pini TaxID=1963835 RepID=A0A212RN72_9PROT|nr:VOC family protein [Arboricoccus pini]SNB74014.1 Glyoxalase/Bleomycin resistance protein/Dioxygenase superfamily protein [Arboricoccus pini]
MAAPKLGNVLETGLYVQDLAKARHFYETVMGLEPMFLDERLCAYPLGRGSVLLIFQQGTTNVPAPTPGGTIPPHEGSGQLHYAFAIAAADLDAWRRHLASFAVPIESEVTWPEGATSLYFRDPDQHLVELTTPGIWANY